MPIELLIARWVAVLWLICGLSHVLYPAQWAALLWPLREQETGGFVLAAMSLPFSLVIILGHNVWIWDLPVIVTVAGWMTTLKCVGYLLVPQAHQFVRRPHDGPSDKDGEKGFRIIGIVLLVLGGVTAFDAFYRR